jgi:hypothetical protein
MSLSRLPSVGTGQPFYVTVAPAHSLAGERSLAAMAMANSISARRASSRSPTVVVTGS